MLDSKKLKQINVDLLRNTLMARDVSTKNSLARETGLSVATCGNILEELLQKGEIREIESGASTGGRPSRQFVYNEEFSFAALLYVRIEGAAKYIHATLVNSVGTVCDEVHREFSDISLEDIESVLDSLLAEHSRIRVISVGIPGIVRDGRIGVCDFPRLSHIPIEDHLKEKYGLDVIAENDVNSAALGFYHRLETTSPESLVYLYYPQDGMPGAGIVINGKVLKGSTNFAGEISYLPALMNRDKQGEAQKERIFAEYIGDTILSVNCMINPELIVVSGQWFAPELIQLVQAYVEQISPEDHHPRLMFEEDIHDSFVDGLKFAGLSKMSCGFEVIQK